MWFCSSYTCIGLFNSEKKNGIDIKKFENALWDNLQSIKSYFIQ